MTTYISSDSEPGKRYELRVGSVEGQLYTLGATISELRKQMDALQDQIAVLEKLIRGR